ncbi:methyl-accepting chemotaxis protein [Massilia sp. KIM]|uniref:methyl-accepting chemotaxis protein n=1 Tax=Massilia sp. KIM TaxID=1955422 RepID=UPI00098EFBBF|nr:methyl-accepting chemotaxis protein [Massilia sp. KIM]OON59129.1 methyl-accepting chemotaxis protein [Massilia sp. KIM]
MKHLRIKHVIASVLGALIALTLVVGGIGYYATQQSVELLQNLALRGAHQQLALSKLVYRMEANRSQILQALQHNPESRFAALHDHPLSNHMRQIERNSAELKQEHDELLASMRLPETREALGRWRQASQDFGVNLVGDAARAVEAGNWDAAHELLGRGINPTYLKSQQAYAELQDYMSKRNERRSIELQEELGFLHLLLAGALALAVLLALLAAVYLVRAITQPLAEAVGIARRVADGDLSMHIVPASRNEFGQLLGALRDMTASLDGIVGGVRRGSEVIASASTQIATGNMDLSSRTEQQASAIEETAASVEELTTTVRQNADNARQANHLAASASDVAVRGGEVVAEVVDTMGAIEASARRIVDIIAVIDGIAFQTNILALNAAVEAARAGEQGRGFAVVASEVRNLAQRSASAAREIKDLITDSVGKVDSGSRLVNQAGATMQEIVLSVRRVADIMGEITAATSEQSAGIEQIHQAISQMDQVTQQNAALVEEAASAAQSLQESAAGLAQQVSVFRLADGAGAARPAARAPARQPRLATA